MGLLILLFIVIGIVVIPQLDLSHLRPVTANEIEHAERRLKSCSERMQLSGLQPLTHEDFRQMDAELQRIKAGLAELTWFSHCLELATLTSFRLVRLFRRWAPLTALMHVAFVFFTVALGVEFFFLRNLPTIHSWQVAVLCVPLCITGWLLFHPFDDQIARCIIEIKENRRKRSLHRLSLQQRCNHTSDLLLIWRDYRQAVQEYSRLNEALNGRRTQLLKVDWRSLKAVEFEQFLREVFEQLGYDVQTTSLTGDKGVDLIATKKDLRLAIQAKGWSDKVGIGAVQEVYTGKEHYKCKECMVITTSSYTKPAKTLARSTNCHLIEGAEIPNLIKGKMRW